MGQDSAPSLSATKFVHGLVVERFIFLMISKMDKSLDGLLKDLRTVLIAESRAQDALKLIKLDKDRILDELNGIIKADNFANDFVTLRKRPSIRVVDEIVASEFMKDVRQVDKQKVEDYFYSGKDLPGLKVELKLIAFKKKSGLI